MKFYLGTHMTNWLSQTEVPLFVSARRLRVRKSFPRALGRWALDSGGFSELSLYGRWVTGPKQYAAEVRRFSSEIGGMDWAAIQDWMCEPTILARTGLTVKEHQVRSVQSYLDLNSFAPEIPWTPVLQGWRVPDYFDHLEMYRNAGVVLEMAPVVGIGSVCRRQGMAWAETAINRLNLVGLDLHGFGMKTLGLPKYGHMLASSDSMAWSLAARREPKIPGHSHKNCANCLEFALRWRLQLLKELGGIPELGHSPRGPAQVGLVP